MFGLLGKCCDIKDFLDALEDAGVQGTGFVSTGECFQGKLTIKINDIDFGLYDLTTKTITTVSNASE